MMIERTPAKIGRLMKKSEMFMTRARQWPGAVFLRRIGKGRLRAAPYEFRSATRDFGGAGRVGFNGGDVLRCNGHAGTDALESVDDDLVAGAQAVANDALAA